MGRRKIPLSTPLSWLWRDSAPPPARLPRSKEECEMNTVRAGVHDVHASTCTVVPFVARQRRSLPVSVVSFHPRHSPTYLKLGCMSVSINTILRWVLSLLYHQKSRWYQVGWPSSDRATLVLQYFKPQSILPLISRCVDSWGCLIDSERTSVSMLRLWRLIRSNWMFFTWSSNHEVLFFLTDVCPSSMMRDSVRAM